MCEKCIHYEVCKYKDGFIKFAVKIPGSIEAVTDVKITCRAFKDDRYFKRPMGTEV